jgi:UDP-N-acetylglucosamine 2-epimerase (non-hydrolysing)
MRVVLVIGTRPQIIKSAPVIHAAKKYKDIELLILHTGQHYDYEMSKIFFNELDLPEPVTNIGVGSGSHGAQTGRMLIELEKVFLSLKPDLVLVPGDTNSTLAAAIAAVKLQIPVAHIESGARSFDMTMPEEVNRRLTDHCSTILFTVSENCSKNLKTEGIPSERIVLVGDTMYESIKLHFQDIEKDNALNDLNLKAKQYLILTMHRAENVDNPVRLKTIIEEIVKLEEIVIFPAHPRTRKQLINLGLLEAASKRLQLLEPVGYYRMLNLIKNAKCVLTDSGGMQKEAFWMSTPCVTLRSNTEWIETIQLGANILCGEPRLIRKTYERITGNLPANFKVNPFYFGGASERIIQHFLSNTRIS